MKKNQKMFLKIFSKKNILINFFVVILIFFSCKKQEPHLPIDQNNLIAILVDIHKAEAAVDAENVFVKDSLGKKYYAQIFDKHHVTKRDFDSTMSLLEHDPDRLQKVYTPVVKELEKGEKTN